MSPIVIDKLMHASSRDTVRSRCLSGKPARQLRTGWTDAWDREDCPGTLPMPLQYMLTAEAQRRIAKAQTEELIGIPVGQIVGTMSSVRPVKDVIFEMIEEFIDASERLGKLMSDG
jgi:NAD(P)H-dependent flavin oxidoreductase YrpB (nitropropane dioxygenase family)